FLTGGSVEKQTGTTDLAKLGGLGKKMPVTFICYLITAAAISGVPPFNGFFSKELIYDGALERGKIFYIAAALGSFLTAASFLKLGHAAFLGKSGKAAEGAKESPVSMLIPMIVIALTCIVFGVWNALPLNNLIQPILGEHRLEGHNFSGLPANMTVVAITIIVLIAAFLNHIYGVKRTGSGLKAVDHIHYAPGLSIIYDKAEKRFFDPYDIGLRIVGFVSKIAWGCDRGIDWVYNVLTVKVTFAFTGGIRKLHNGSYSTYILWSLAGALVMILFLMGVI
ncbi:MAG: proton-conducting transporter membrane subunit, partial [Candidatus Omnitrophota bacterium]